MKYFIKIALFGATALYAGLHSQKVLAQFSLDGLVGSVVGAATKEVGAVVSDVVSKGVTSIGGGSSIAKPSGWPSQYKFYDYANAPVPKQYLGNIGGSGIVYYKDNGKNFRADALDFDTLPLQFAFVRVHGSGKRKIAMFTDPTCPYSRMQEQALNQIDNVTIYTFVAPILGSKSNKIVEQIQCQPTNQARAQAYDNWVLNRVEPTVVAPCKHVADRILGSLGRLKAEDGRVYSQSSPTTVFDNDITVVGGLDRNDLRDYMSYKTRR